MKKILICAACVVALFSSSALAQVPTPTVNVTAGHQFIHVSWTAVNDAVEYIVFYSQSPISYSNANPRGRSAPGVSRILRDPYEESTTISSPTSLTIINLDNDTRYYVRVIARQSDDPNFSLPSTEVSAIPRAIPPPAPTGLRASSGEDREVFLGWTTSIGARGYDYNIYYSQSPISNIISSLSLLRWPDVHLRRARSSDYVVVDHINNFRSGGITRSGENFILPAGTYYFRVTALKSGAGESFPSNEVSLTVGRPEPTPPEPAPPEPDPEPAPPEPDPEPAPPEPDPEPEPPEPDPEPEPTTPEYWRPRETYIYFINESGVSEAETMASRDLLKKLYDFSPTPGSGPLAFPGKYYFGYFYNASAWWDDDFGFGTAEESSELRTFREYMLRRMFNYLRFNRPTTPVDLEQLRKIMTLTYPRLDFSGYTLERLDELVKSFEKYNMSLSRTRSYLRRRRSDGRNRHLIIQAEQYFNNLKRGNRVVVVSHGQGNLLANVALEAVARGLPTECKRSLEQIGVATPASKQFRPFYRTLTEDRVINAQRRETPTTLEGNVTNDGRFSALAAWLRSKLFNSHDFRTEYMRSGHQSRTEIDKQMFSIFQNTPFPEPWPPPSCLK